MMDDPSAAPGRGALTAYPLRGTRRPQPRAEDAGARTRAAAQRHLDARGERLRAYAAALEGAAAAAPAGDRRTQLERQLASARRVLRAAGQTRLPDLPAAATPADAAGRGAGSAAPTAPNGRPGG
jgi:hypothetical protein